jgi:heterodisulfide reductase subunit A
LNYGFSLLVFGNTKHRMPEARYEKDVGVILCDCGGTLRNRLDFEKLQDYLEQLPTVAQVSCCSRFCQQNECARAMKSASKKQVKRLVVGACGPEIFDETLREAMVGAPFNQGLLWCVNIREHCGWVASGSKKATDKAIEVLDAAVRRVKAASAVKSKKTGIRQDVLVLGGAVAAMQAAVALSRLGHRVTLVHNGEKLGGLAAEIPQLYGYLASNSHDAETLLRKRVDELIEQVKSDKQIRVETCASLESVEGEFGNFTVAVNSARGKRRLKAGALVLGMGTVVVWPGLAQLFGNGLDIPKRKRIAIVMDVAAGPNRDNKGRLGIREQGPAVSAQALSAAELLVKHFRAEVKLYCHNIRVAATGMEDLYRRARKGGVVVVKYESPPVVSNDGPKNVVCVQDPLLGCEVSEEFDLVIMASEANDDKGRLETPDKYAANGDGNNELLRLIKGLRAGPDGTLQVDSIWFLPTKTNRKGVFIVGSARGTDELRSSQADGLAAADEIHNLLKDKSIEILDDAAAVDGDKCVLCLTCMRICPHGAVSIDVENSVALISAVACQRCGICAAQCPAGAIELPRYTQSQMQAEIGDQPRVTVFACENSAYPAATAVGVAGTEYNASVRLIRVPCAGKVGPKDVLGALEKGAEKVMVLGCHLESCQYLTGSTFAANRLKRIGNMLEKAGFDRSRVFFGALSAVEPARFIEYVND